MSKKGFTLIELLAVIVILAIIALIVAPITLNVIENSREETNKRSIDLYGRAAETAVKHYHMNTGVMPTNFEDIRQYITYSGADISCKIEKIYEDGEIFISECTIDNVEVKDYAYGVQEKTKCTINRQVSGQITLGDEVTCGIEKFNVLSVNNSTNIVSMLAAKAITLTDTPEQSDTPTKVVYSSKSDDSNYKPVDLTYIQSYLDKYSNVIKNNYGLTFVSSNLISNDQLIILGWSGTQGFNNVTNPPTWLGSRTFWTSVKGQYYNSGSVLGGHTHPNSVRPVVEVLSSELY